MPVAAAAVDVLATARLVRLVRADRITRPVREAVIREAYLARGVLEPSGSWEDHVYADDDPPAVATLVGCPWCLAVWVGLAVALARRAAPRLWDPVARGLALSYLAAVIEIEAEDRGL